MAEKKISKNVSSPWQHRAHVSAVKSGAKKKVVTCKLFPILYRIMSAELVVTYNSLGTNDIDTYYKGDECHGMYYINKKYCLSVTIFAYCMFVQHVSRISSER